MTSVPAPRGLGRDTAARRRARSALIDVIWTENTGARRLPSFVALRAAIDACDPRDIGWVCETNSSGPVYLLATREWIDALARVLTRLKVRRVLEVCAGDGFLSSQLALRHPQFTVTATDNHAWRNVRARMNVADVRQMRGVSLAGITMPSAGPQRVHKAAARTAVNRHRPDVTLVSWAPPGDVVKSLIVSKHSKLVLDFSVDGDVCGDVRTTWRYHKEFLEGALQSRALCRLDGKALPPQTTCTLYYGAAHPAHGVDVGSVFA